MITGTTTINKLKKLDYFKLVTNKEGKLGVTVYVYDGYNLRTRRYQAYKYDNINVTRQFKKETIVSTEFEF